jgi:hypothetical protein
MYLYSAIVSLTIHIDINRDLGTDVVSIYVGPDRKHYVVHKQLLTSQSDYFDKALNGNFKEAEENKIHLEEDDPAAIGLMIGVFIPSLCLASLVLQCWAFQTVFHLPRFLIFEIIQILICCSGKLVTNTIGMHSDYIIELLHI